MRLILDVYVCSPARRTNFNNASVICVPRIHGSTRCQCINEFRCVRSINPKLVHGIG
jgi:hypothetical protein